MEMLKKIALLFILLSASLLPASFAGGKWRFMEEATPNTPGATTSSVESKKSMMKSGRENNIVRESERNLRSVHTRDYDSYDPSPTFVKPPFKLIPN